MKFRPSTGTLTAAGAALLIATMLGGCATPRPTAQVASPNVPSVPSAPSTRHLTLAQNDQVFVKVVPRDGLIMLPADLERLAQVVRGTIDDKRRLNGPGTNADAYEVQVTVTRYDKGSSVRRAVTAALGQMRIDAHVLVRTTVFEQTVAEFDTTKSSGSGSSDAATENIADVESAFAASLAAVLTGK